MKILITGDLFGLTGQKMIKKHLPKLREKYEPDLIIANVENTTFGKGISLEHYKELKAYGIDIMTTGNHVFSCNGTIDFIEEVKDLLRPLNSNPYHPGPGTIQIIIKNKKIRITNLLGTALMPAPAAENPYYILENIIKKDDSAIHIVDFHAETTAEKIAFSIYFDGIITVIYGTHTHVQTADERISDKGSAFITDIGMTGPSEGVIGAAPWTSIRRMKEGLPTRILVDNDPRAQLNGVFIEIDENTNKVSNIQRIFIKDKVS